MEKTVLKALQPAPNFSLAGDDSQIHSLKDFLGSPLVIFFYPKDLTPGCTLQACDFSAQSDEFRKHKTTIIGISRDSLASHMRFKSKYSLRPLLLSDPDMAVHKHYGAWGEKTLYGKVAMGVIRSTFLLNEQGLVIKAWYKVRVKNHVSAVLDILNKRPDLK
jgi:peroxiredoxin Q/BCP